MSIRVEFFGIPRRRAGVAETVVEIDGDSVRLGTVLSVLAARYPGLAEDCVRGERLRSPTAANLAGEQFLTDPDCRIRSGESLLLLSADGGG